MVTPLHISLIALLITLSGFALYFLRRDSGKNERKKENRETPVNASSKAEFSLTHQFFALLLKQHKNEQQDPGRLCEAFETEGLDRLNDPTLFPRQPLALPRLLQAMKSQSNGSQALVEIILEDPGLTTDVLKLANSPIYRNTEKEVQSIDYALVMLGLDGLHSLVCSSLMKPIFAKRRADGFNSSLFWDWALASAQGAQHFAKLNRVDDPTQVYMLTLMTRLAELVILRICARLNLEKFLTNTPKAVLPVIEKYRREVTGKLICDWGFDENWKYLLWHESDKQNIDDSKYAQYLAPEFGCIQVLLKKNMLSSNEATENLCGNQLPFSTAQQMTAVLS